MAQSFDEWANNPANRGKSVSEFFNQNQTPTQTVPTQTTAPAQTANATTTTGTTTTTPVQATYYSPTTDNVAPFSNELPYQQTTQTTKPTLSSTQIQELDALASKNQWTETDQKNYDWAVKNYGYVLPSTGKFDTNITSTGTEDISKIKDVDPKILAFDQTIRETDFSNQKWVENQLNENQKQLAALYKQIETLQQKEITRTETERDVAKSTTETLVNQSSAYQKNAIEEQYKKYNLNGQYEQLTSIGNQIMSLMASNTGKTMATSMSSKYYRNMAMLSTASQIIQGNLDYGLRLAGELYNADIDGYQSKINYYNQALTRADNNLISLSKEFRNEIEKKIGYYDKVIKQKEEDKKKVEDIVRNTNGNTLYRAMNNGYDLYDIYNEENQKKLLLATQEQNMVDSMAVKYPDVNILPTDSFETAYTKAQNSLNWGNELRDAGSDAMVINTMYDIHSQYPELTWDECYSMAVQEVNEINAAQKLAESGKTSGTTTTQTAPSSRNVRLYNDIANIYGEAGSSQRAFMEKVLRGMSGMSTGTWALKSFFEPGVTIGDYQNMSSVLKAIKNVSLMSSFEEAKKNGLTGAMSEGEWEILSKACAGIAGDIVVDKKGNASIKTSEEEAIRKFNNFYTELQENLNEYYKTDVPAEGIVINFGDGSLLQCGEYINKKAGVQVGESWENKEARVKSKGHIGANGVQVGDVIYQKTGTPWGHVAYVEAIQPDGSVIVSEANWVEGDVKNGGKVRYGRIVQPQGIYGYIRPSELKK